MVKECVAELSSPATTCGLELEDMHSEQLRLDPRVTLVCSRPCCRRRPGTWKRLAVPHWLDLAVTLVGARPCCRLRPRAWQRLS